MERKLLRVLGTAVPNSMYFWMAKPPKSTIEYSAYELRIEIGNKQTTPKTSRRKTTAAKQVSISLRTKKTADKGCFFLVIPFRVRSISSKTLK